MHVKNQPPQRFLQRFFKAWYTFFRSDQGLSSVCATCGMTCLSTSLIDIIFQPDRTPGSVTEKALTIGTLLAALVVGAIIYRRDGK